MEGNDGMRREGEREEEGETVLDLCRRSLPC